MDYSLLPATVARRVSDVTLIPIDQTSRLMGDGAGDLLTQHIESFPLVQEIRVPERSMPKKRTKCDYLLVTDDLLVGIEFTVARPPASLATGRVSGLDRLIPFIASKMEQAYKTFDRVDPAREKRRLPLVVFASPNIVDPLLNERVHEHLVERGITSDASELMTCHAPEFHDLVEYAASKATSLASAVRQWRDSEYGGANLDHWLADRDALGVSTRRRMDAALADIEPVLTRRK